MNTAYNIVISPNFLVWKLCGNSTFPHHFHIRKLGEITIFYAVNATQLWLNLNSNFIIRHRLSFV